MRKPKNLLTDEQTDKLNELPNSQWPPLLADLIDVFESLFKRRGFDANSAIKMAVYTTSELAQYLGGRSTYIPKGAILQVALRNMEIVRRMASGTERPAEIAEHFELSEIHVYEIYRNWRAQRKAARCGATGRTGGA